MRVKLTHASLAAAEADGGTTILEADPVVLAQSPPAAPFSLVHPIITVFTTVPPVVLAAARLRQVPPPKPSTMHGTDFAAGAKKRQKPGGEGAVIKDKFAAYRNVKPRVTKAAPPPPPFKQVVTVGLAPVPPTLVAQPEDVAALFEQMQNAGRKGPGGAKQRYDEISDAKVSLRVVPAKNPVGRPRSVNRAQPGASGGAGPKKTAAAGEAPTRGPGRPPKVPRRTPTLEIPLDSSDSDEDGKPLHEWHAGMTTYNGITYVDPVASTLRPPPSPVLKDTPPRWRPMPLTAGDLPKFSDDDAVLAALQYQRYLAITVGRLPTFSARLQNGFNAEQRLYRERLERILLARDGRAVERPPTGGTRRSTRARFAPDSYVPTLAGGGYGRRQGDNDDLRAFDPAELTAVRLGSGFQAELPDVRPKPSAPTAEEARWGEGLVLEAGAVLHPGQQNHGGVNSSFLPLSAMAAGSREAVINAEVTRLAGAVGPVAAEQLGLGAMGACMVDDLTPEEQERLYEGMKTYGRDYHGIHNEFLPEVPPHRMAAYYYDVWKLRAVPAAAKWYDDKAQDQADREAEAEALERQRAEDAARRAERQEASNRRRQVKEAVAWIRASARGPTEVSFNKPIVRDRALRAATLLKEPELAMKAAAPTASPFAGVSAHQSPLIVVPTIIFA